MIDTISDTSDIPHKNDLIQSSDVLIALYSTACSSRGRYVAEIDDSRVNLYIQMYGLVEWKPEKIEMDRTPNKGG